MTTNFKCRLCSTPVDGPPLLQLSDFPRAAQWFPTSDQFGLDQPIKLSVYGCQHCSLVQIDADPVSYYKEVITAASLGGESLRQRIALIDSLVTEFDLAGETAIDVGAGKGEIVRIFRDCGLIATGLECGKDNAAKGVAEGLQLCTDYVVDHNPTKPYGFFTCLNYLEHQPDIGLFVRAIARITTDDAVGYVTVPNFEHLQSTGCLYEFVADHLVYFSRRSLCLAFEANGFEVIRDELINNNNDIAIVVRKHYLPDFSADMSVIYGLVSKINDTIATLNRAGCRVAVWGAGHRTLALLSIGGIHGISHVIDSAQFKQGRYTPIGHKPIVAPEATTELGIDAIIIMVPGIYPDEVLRRVRNMPHIKHIYMLKDNDFYSCDSTTPDAYSNP